MTGHKLASDVSVGHVVIDADEGRTSTLVRGWQDPSIPRLQRNLVEGELANMRAGRAPRVYTVAADALQAADLRDPSVLEIGCASGYYSEVFRHMVDAKLRYTGVDYSSALIGEARATYSDVPFAVADGSRLPFCDEAFDVAISGCVLLHMPEYAASIRETFRVTSSHAIFHRTPVVATGDTTWLRKRAYGVEVVELVFNEDELRALFAASGAEVAMTWEVERHQLPGIAEAVRVVTYLCSVNRQFAGRQP
jgi:SAM-dependent methyltransferase